MSKAIKRRRRRLWEADPHCHWCKRELAWEETTADHMNQKVKVETRPRQGKIVLACEKCNLQRSLDAHKEMSQVALWKRTGNVPYMKRIWRFLPNHKTSFVSRLWLIYYYFTFNPIFVRLSLLTHSSIG